MFLVKTILRFFMSYAQIYTLFYNLYNFMLKSLFHENMMLARIKDLKYYILVLLMKYVFLT
jgi:hypothetical protein